MRQVSEADIQDLIQAHPNCLPIAEIDPIFANPVPICRELNTVAGSIDNLLMTPSGLPVIVECKLWRNPEGRRAVVAQILDYAKELSRWSSSDLQREVSRKLKREGNPLLELVREADPSIDEPTFNDAITANLRRGRFLLLIVGDGIREGTEAIAEYIQSHAGLHFSLGLVEMPIFILPDGGRLVTPRVLARTIMLTRTVVAVPDGFAIQEAEGSLKNDEPSETARYWLQFWGEFLPQLKLDDPEQGVPKPARGENLSFMLPAPSGSSWLNVYCSKRREVGISLSSTRNSPGENAMRKIVADWTEVQKELGRGSRLSKDSVGRARPTEAYTAGPLNDQENRRRAFEWLAERVNTYVNVLRPRVRAAISDHESRTV